MNAASTSATVISAAFNYAGRRSGTTTGYGFNSVTFKNCTNSVNILNSYAVNSVSGYFAGNNGAFSNNVTFDNCSFNGLIEGALEVQGAFASQREKVTADQFIFNNCSIGSDAKLYATCGLAKSGPISIGLTSTVNTVASGIQLPAEEYRDNSFAKAEVTKKSNNTFTVTSSVEFDDIKVYVYGGMSHAESGSSGTFRYLAKYTESAGVYTLDKIAFSVEDLPATGAIAGYGNNRFFDINGTVTYFGKGTCTGITLTSASLTVVAYKDGVAVAAGKLKDSAGNLTTLNLKA